MPNIYPMDVLRRLGDVESALAGAGAEIAALRRRGRCDRWLRRLLLAAGAVAIGTAVAIDHSTSTLAQTGSEPQPLTVKAPFVVVNGAGRAIMTVANDRIAFFGSGDDAVIEASGTGLTVTVPLTVSDGGEALLDVSSEGLAVKAPLKVSGSGSTALLEVAEEGIAAAAPLAVSDGSGKVLVEISDQGVTATAPFKVTDAGAKPLAIIEDWSGVGRGVFVYNEGGSAVAQLFSHQEGSGALIVRNGRERATGSSPGAGIDFENGDAFLALKGADDQFFVELKRKSAMIRAPLQVKDDKEKVLLEVSAKGVAATTSLKVGDGSGKIFAEISSKGMKATGPLRISDAGGKPLASLEDISGVGPGLYVYNGQGSMVGQMFARQDGSGALIVRNGRTSERDTTPGAGIDFEDGNARLKLKGADDKFFVELDREGSTIRGPLTVSDGDDKAIALIQDATSSGGTDGAGGETTVSTDRGIHILNKAGVVIAKAAADDAGMGYLIVRDSKKKGGAVAALMTTESGSQLTLAHSDGGIRADVTSEQGLFVYNREGTTVGFFGVSGKGRGILELNDGNGQKMVEAGSLDGAKGYVLVQPYEARATNPSVLMGGKGSGK